MKLRHLVGALALTLTVGAAVPALAQYPPTVGNGRVTRSELKQCQCTQFSGDGFEPGTTVTVYDKNASGIERLVGTADVDNKGMFKLKVCFDEHSSQGQHTLIARGVEPGGGAHEVHATVNIDGSVCFKGGDEVHNASSSGGGGVEVGGEEQQEQPRGSGSAGSGSSGSGPDVDGVGLPRTGAEYVVPGLLLGFALVVTGTGVVHLTRRRRLVTG